MQHKGKNIQNKNVNNELYELIKKDNEISDKDIDKILNSLNKYSIESPKEEDINSCIKEVKFFLPVKKENIIQRFFKSITFELGYIDKRYWIFTIGMYLLYFLTFNLRSNIYNSSLLISPMPLVISIIEILKGKDEGILELELSFKYSVIERNISKFIIALIYTILLNFLVSIGVWDENLQISFLKLNIIYITPALIMTYISLLIARKIKSYYSSLISICLWIMLCCFISTNFSVVFILKQVYVFIYLIMCLIMFSLIIFELKMISKDNNFNLKIDM